MAYIRGRPTHSLIVFHKSDGADQAEKFSENITVCGIAVPYIHVPTYDAYPFFYLSNPQKRLLRIVGDFQPDIILTITPYIPFGIGRSTLYVAKKLGVPLVGSFDVQMTAVSQYYALRILRLRWALKLWLWYVSLLMASYEKCARILVPSRFVLEHVQDRYKRAKCVMFPRAVNGEMFSPIYRNKSFKVQHGIGGKTVILYTGRLALEKSLETLMDTYAGLKAQYDDIALVLVGDGPERKRLERRGLADLVLTGVLEGERLSQAYASADIFAFPSTVDAGPVVILEAMASGLPVVVFDQGGAQDAVIHGETGFVAKDVVDFTGCLDKLIRDTQLRSAIGANARKYAESQQWDRIFDQLIVAFNEVIGESN